MGRAGEHFLRAADLDDGLGRAAQAAGRVDHVIEQQAGLALDVADDVHDLGAVGLLAALVHDGQAQTHLHGERARTRNAADIRRDDDQILAAVAEAAQIVAGEQRRAVEVVDRDVKEALDLRCVQVHGQHTVSTGDGQQVRHELGRDRIARLGLAVLTGIAEIRDDGGDTAGGGALHRVDHDQQLHKAVVDRLAGALHDEHVHAADGLVDGDGALAVGKRRDRALAQGDAKILADHVRQFGVG